LFGDGDAHQALLGHQLRHIEREARIVRPLQRALLQVGLREPANGIGEKLLFFGEIEIHAVSVASASPAGRARHPASPPALRMISDHLASSAAMSAAYSAGVLGSVSAPSVASRRRTSSSASAALSAAFSFATIGAGVPAAATMP